MTTTITLQTSPNPGGNLLFRGLSALTVVLALAPLLLTSREMWDGVIGSYALATRDNALLSGWLLESNWYLSYGLLRSAAALDQVAGWPVWLTLKLWTCLMIFGIGHETARLTASLFDMHARTARWAFPLVVSFPIWFVFFSYTSMVGHLTSVWLGLAGFGLLRRASPLAVMTGALAMVASYQLASNCTFLPMLALGFYVLQPEERGANARRLVFVVFAAVAVFAATRVIWPPFGNYAGYNALLSPLHLSSWIQYLKAATLFTTWLLLLLPVLIVWLRVRQTAGKPLGAQAAIAAKPTRTNRRRVVEGGVLAGLLLAASLPYIGVGIGGPLLVPNLGNAGNSLSTVMTSGPYAPLIGPRYGGWGARHLLLALVPLSMLTVWLAQAVQTLLAEHAPERAPASRLIVATLTACVAFNLCWLVPGHWAKLRRHAEEQVMLHTLRSLPAPPAGKVNLVMPPETSYLNNVYEANHLLYLAYGRNEWAAYSAPDRQEVLTLMDESREVIFQKSPDLRKAASMQNLMKDYNWSRDCTSSLTLDLPTLAAADIVWNASRAADKLPKARITTISSSCSDGAAPWR